MLKARVNNKYDFVIDKQAAKNIDMIEIKAGIFHIIKDNKSYNAEVLEANHDEKKFIIRVNGNKYTVQIQDKYDELLKKLGMENATALKIKELKAPMPGLVIEVRVKEGDTVKKDDPLVILQAMKMENALKSPADTVIKKIYIKKDDTIEKNQLLVSFH